MYFVFVGLTVSTLTIALNLFWPDNLVNLTSEFTRT